MSRRSKFTPEFKQSIIKQARSGTSTYRLAKEYGVSTGSIRLWLKQSPKTRKKTSITSSGSTSDKTTSHGPNIADPFAPSWKINESSDPTSENRILRSMLRSALELISLKDDTMKFTFGANS